MTLIMRSGPSGWTDATTRGLWRRRLLASLKRWLTEYRRRRAEEVAIAQLHAMSDRELKDIGLIRSEIGYVVRYGVERPISCPRSK